MTTPYADPQSVHTPSTGTAPPASWGQAVRDDLQFLNTWVGCMVQRSANTTLNDDLSRSYLQWTGTDLFDSDAFHDPASGTPERITIPTGLGGKYLVSFTLVMASGTTTARSLQGWVRQNGSTEYLVQGFDMTPTTTSVTPAISGSFPLIANAADYIEIGAAQKTAAGGSAIDVDYGYAWVRYMGA